MATQQQLRQGTSLQHQDFIGAAGEVTYNTDRKILVTHDGVTAGGNPIGITNVGDSVEIRNKNGVLVAVFGGGLNVDYVPIPYPSRTIPAGYIAMVGQSINATQYPNLARLYGARLPDMRGQTIKGAPDNRGVLSFEYEQVGQHFHAYERANVSSSESGGGDKMMTKSIGTGSYVSTVPYASHLKNLVDNIAFIYIVKAG